MHEVTIVISTRNRLEKLRRTLASIPLKAGPVEIKIAVACDNDPETFKALGGSAASWNGGRAAGHQVDNLIIVRKNAPGCSGGDKPSGAVICRNILAGGVEDALLWATDDIVFKPHSIEHAVDALAQRFTDGDGVVGFNQVNHKRFSPTGVGIMGQAFLRRYPEKHLFYPGYFHFACQEIHWLAQRLGKFHFEPKATLVHHHPAEREYQSEMDETHREARVFKSRDMALIDERTKGGAIWGL